MTITIHLPPAQEAQIREKSAREHKGVESVLQDVIAAGLAEPAPAAPQGRALRDRITAAYDEFPVVDEGERAGEAPRPSAEGAGGSQIPPRRQGGLSLDQ